MDKNIARKQIKKLYFIDGFGGLMIAGASWVALLSARGFSTVEIGLLESIFHIASMNFEIPSGAMADTFGRKKVMILSGIMSIVSSLMMIVMNTFGGIAVAMICSALSYNLASGTREALAYDSLKYGGIEEEYGRFAANDLIIYRLTASLGTLMAGIALMLGYKKAYLVDILFAVLMVLVGCSLVEVKTNLQGKTDVVGRLREVSIESIRALKENRKIVKIILFNSCIGAVATLIVFFLQSKLPELGLKSLWLGPALFIVGLGSVIGAKSAEHCQITSYKKIGAFCLICISFAFSSIFMNQIFQLMVGGFIGGFADSLIEVKSDVVLNEMIPSDQRATLMSVNSFAFSCVMIVLAPILGWLF